MAASAQIVAPKPAAPRPIEYHVRRGLDGWWRWVVWGRGGPVPGTESAGRWRSWRECVAAVWAHQDETGERGVYTVEAH